MFTFSVDLADIKLQLIGSSSLCLSYLGGGGPACADVTSPKHLLIAQDTAVGVLLVVQELLEGAETVLGVRGARNLLQQPADLIGIVLHLEEQHVLTATCPSMLQFMYP